MGRTVTVAERPVSLETFQQWGYEFPLPLNLANSRLHWAEKNRKRQEYFTHLDTLVLLKKLPKPPVKPWGKAQAIVSLRSARLMDQDNRHARLKWIWDWLESRGYLEDDKMLDYSLTHNAVPRKHVGVHICLWPVA